MKSILLKHLYAFLIVTVLFSVLGISFSFFSKPIQVKPNQETTLWLQSKEINWQDPLHQLLIADVIDLKSDDEDGDAFVRKMARLKSDETAKRLEQLRHQKGLVFDAFPEFLVKFIWFLLIFSGVLLGLIWASQTLGLYRFILSRQTHRTAFQKKFYTLCSFLFLVLLFSPGYLIAYMIKPIISSDSLFLMIVLGLLTNGALVLHSQKFLNLLNQEFEKGYVLAARIRNVNEDFRIGKSSGLTWHGILSFKKTFPGHLLNHILLNAKRQYLNSVRELAAFTITSLIILEMALNIQGRYGYELLRQVLYGNYADVLAMMLGLFLIVKLTEAGLDYVIYKQNLKYGNESTCGK